MQDQEKNAYKLTVKSVEGINDYPHWLRDARAYLTRQDPLLLGIARKPIEENMETEKAWKSANAQAKATIFLLFSTPVQIRAITICDN